jgi:MoaA/NifB/PqqE/SkfB family radical SAM enzyme
VVEVVLKIRRCVLNVLYRCAVIVRDLRGFTAPTRRRIMPPTDVNIEPSNLCNADCIFCGYQFQERPHGQIAVDLGQEIIQAAKRFGATRIGLTPVVGEPLVHRRLEELVRAAAEPPQPLRVGLTTNGIMLTPNRYQTLVDAGLGSICISMTYPDEDEYFRIYRNKGLRKIVTNIEGILDLYNEHRCDVTLAIRTMRDDWSDHPLFVRARSKGWSVDRNIFFDDWSGRTNALMEAEGLWRRLNRSKVLPCSMLYSGPHFFSDGRATACGCRDLDGKSDLALDPQALLRDMRQVYADGAVEQLRERFRLGDAPDICRSCRHYNAEFEGESQGVRFRQLLADLGALVYLT